MSFITDFPHTRTYDSDLGFLIEEYKRLNGSYDVLVQIYETIKKDIKDITIEQLQEWLDDGTFYNIISQVAIPQQLNSIVDTVCHPQYMFETARSYINNNAQFAYGGPSFLTTIEDGDIMKPITEIPLTEGKLLISCSTLVIACLNGLTYENSRCENGTRDSDKITGGSNINRSGSTFIDLFSKEFLKYRETGDTFIYTSGLAHMLRDKGLLHEVTLNSINKLSPGDILFYADNTVSPTDWNNLHHCEIFCGFRGNNQYNVYTVTSEGQVKLLVRSFTDDYPPKLKFYARLPVNSNNIASVDMLENSITPFDLTTTVGGETQRVYKELLYSKSLVTNRPYIITVKARNVVGNNPRMVIIAVENDSSVATTYSTTLFFKNANCQLGNDNYYTVLTIPSGAPTLKWLGFYLSDDSGTVSCNVVDIAILEFGDSPKIL